VVNVVLALLRPLPALLRRAEVKNRGTLGLLDLNLHLWHHNRLSVLHGLAVLVELLDGLGVSHLRLPVLLLLLLLRGVLGLLLLLCSILCLGIVILRGGIGWKGGEGRGAEKRGGGGGGNHS